MFVCVLAVINVGNLVRKERLKQKYRLIVEAGSEQLCLNTARPSELEDLPGIGPVLAKRIIEYRERVGRYESLEELKEVKGIGDNLYQRIFPYIRL